MPRLSHAARWTVAALAVAGLAVALAPAPSVGRDPTPAGKPESYTQTLPGDAVKFDMVGIPGGEFLMGSKDGETDRGNDEGPQHAVKLNPFWMMKTEATWDIFDLYWKSEKAAEGDTPEVARPMGDADAITRPTPPYADETFGHAREGHPVLCITHHAAMECCRWLTKVTGKIYRLPTEAEWEYACRAGSTTPFNTGNDPAALADVAWYAANSNETTHPVGTKKPNAWGLYDMHGNVAEWCLDHYKKDFYSSSKYAKFTLQPVNKPTLNRYSYVVRGGSWADEPGRLRSACRRGSDKTWLKRDPQRPQSIWWMTDADFVGFRIVRPVAEQDNLKNIRSTVTRESP